jgi:hypothetical protein
MNLYMPLGSSPDGGRKRLYKMGALADVATAQGMYPYITPHHAKIEGGEHRPRIPSRPLAPPQPHVGVLACFCSSAEGL